MIDLVVPEALCGAIAEHARSEADREVCGLLVGRRAGDRVEVLRAHRTANVAAEGRTDRYTVDPREILRLEEALDGTDSRLVGVYHSHPHSPPLPSPHDRRNASLWPAFVHAIVGTLPDGSFQVRWWWSDSDGVLSSATPCIPAASSPSRASKAAGSPPN